MNPYSERRWKYAFFRRIAPWIARLAAPCPEIARLASKSCERPLNWRERWRMKFHYLICDWCRRYTAQVSFIHRMAPKLSQAAPQFQRRTMPPEVRERLKRRLAAGGPPIS